jgi:hypothetical protein
LITGLVKIPRPLCIMYLVECIIQALVEVVEIAEDDGLTQLHGYFDPVDVETDLAVLLIIYEARTKYDGRFAHIKKLLKNGTSVRIG